MSNKIKYNLKNVHAAIQSRDGAGGYSYGTPVAIPGAVSLSMDAQGETSPFYADGIVYFRTVSNNGYSGDLEIALIPDWFREQVLKEIKDNNGVLIENNEDITESNIADFGKAALTYTRTGNVAYDYTNTTGSFTNLPLGYYMVYPRGANINVDTYTSIVSLTTTKPNASVVQKAEYPTLEKVDDDQSVELGQIVNYTLTSKVPDTTGYNTFTFAMHDQMTDGLTFNASSIDVKIDGTSIGAYTAETNEGGYTYTTETASDGYATAFKIDIPVMRHQDKVGKTITVTYNARVNSNAVTQVEKNRATLEYSNNPKDSTSKTTTPPDEEKVFSAKIIINKYDGSNSDAKLAGAKFVLRCKSVTETTGTGTKSTATVGSYYKLTGEGTTVSPYVATWVGETDVDTKVTANNPALESDLKNNATVVTTDANGAASFEGLENGEYELIEVAAPAGYNQIKGVAATITVAGTDTATANIQYTANVANNSGTELPSTGGIGTTIFYILGGLLVVGAAVILVARRKAQD